MAAGARGVGGDGPVIPLGALAALAGVEVAGVGDDDLLGLAVGFERARRFLDAAQCRVLGELDVRGSTDLEHGMRTAGWLAREAALPTAAARRQVRVGVALRRLPSVEAALVEGRIGIDHARVLADAATPRIVDVFDAAVPALLAEVDTTRFETWARQVRWVADQLDADGGHDPAGDEPVNRVHARWVGDVLHLQGRLTGPDAQIVKQTLDTLTDAAFRRARRDQTQAPDLLAPSRSELTAQALVEALRAAIATTTPTGTAAPAADATFVFFADRPDLAIAPDGSVLPFGRAGALLCDPTATGIVLDDAGVPLDLGRTHRYANRDQRRALAARDGGCVFPGCDAPVGWCDAHHITEWDTDHGRTDLANLALLCRHHHGITHRRGWTMTTTDDQWFHWTTPHGHHLSSQRWGRRRTGPAPPTPP